MKVTIPEVDIARTSVQRINVGEIKVGEVEINSLVLNNVHVQTSTGIAKMRDVQVTLTLQFKLDYKIGINIDLGFFSEHVGYDGTLDLGSTSIAVEFHDLDLPGLANLSFDVQSLAAPNLKAVAGPIKNLNLGAAMAEQIQARNLVTPTSGFQISGLSLGKARAEGVGLPDAAIEEATITHVQGGTLPLSALTIPTFDFPPVKIPAVTSENVDATSNTETVSLSPADTGVLSVTPKVDITVRLQIDRLELDNITASAKIGEMELGSIVLPYEVFDVNLSQIGIETILIPQLEVS